MLWNFTRLMKNGTGIYCANYSQKFSLYTYCIFTHHGRTDHAGKSGATQKEMRFLSSLEDAEILYDHILNEKLSPEKGYKKVHLMSVAPNIGSGKLSKIKDSNSGGNSGTKTSTLSFTVQQLVKYFFEQANQVCPQFLQSYKV